MKEQLEARLREVTEQFMTTCSKQSHKRTRLYLQMQQLNREIKRALITETYKGEEVA